VNFVRVDVLSGKSEVDAFAAVPEPSTVSLILLATAAFGAGRWIRVRRVKP